MKKEALRFEGVSVEDSRFGGLLNATFCIYQGETVAITGLLQSGKKSLLSIIAGRLRNYTGSIFVFGKEQELSDDTIVSNCGLASIGERSLLFNNLSVMDNICLPQGQKKLFAQIDNKIEDELTKWLFNEINPEVFNKEIDQLSGFEKMMLEILKVIYGGARILIFSSAFIYLNDSESREIYRIIEHLNAFGVSILLETDNDYTPFDGLITRILVIRNGITTNTIYQNGTGGFDRNTIRHAIAGHMYNKPDYKEESLTHEESRADYIRIAHRKKHQEINIPRSSIIGLYDPDERLPNSVVELIALFNQHYVLYLNGKCVEPKSVSDLIDLRISIITKEFENDLIFYNLSPEDNVSLHAARIFSKDFIYRKRTAKYIFDDVIGKYKVLRHCADLGKRSDCYGLTFEQQYELMVAKWLAINPKIIITFAPLFNHDIKSIELYRELQVSLSREGKILIIIATNADYLQDYCFKVYQIQ